MPRLGTGQDDERSPSEGGDRNVGVARAYPGGNGRDTNGLIRMMAVLLIVFLLRNLFLKDYRTDEIIALKTAGLSEDEISLYVPRTYEEKSQLRKQLSTKYTSEDAILMMDVAKLKEQVKVLNERLGISDDNRQVMEPNEETGGEGGIMDEEKVVDVEKVEKVEKVDTKEDTMEKMEELEEIDSMERASTG